MFSPIAFSSATELASTYTVAWDTEVRYGVSTAAAAPPVTAYSNDSLDSRQLRSHSQSDNCHI
jgi:hypothetical protein